MICTNIEAHFQHAPEAREYRRFDFQRCVWLRLCSELRRTFALRFGAFADNFVLKCLSKRTHVFVKNVSFQNFRFAWNIGFQSTRADLKTCSFCALAQHFGGLSLCVSVHSFMLRVSCLSKRTHVFERPFHSDVVFFYKNFALLETLAAHTATGHALYCKKLQLTFPTYSENPVLRCIFRSECQKTMCI